MINKKYYLIRGDVNLGLVTHNDDDFPWSYGVFAPSNEYQAIAHLFLQQEKLIEAEEYGESLDRIYEAITKPGIYLKSLQTEQSIPIDGVFIQENKIGWRWV
ncbi:MAG: hypothetical protein QNJ54_29395 [Prochloraceae cyanobacterium]|nr:hypothetical protein [Prochloraceae cyanobacterium]